MTGLNQALRFIEKIRANQDDMVAKIADLKHHKSLENIVLLAKSLNFDFTADDFKQAIKHDYTMRWHLHHFKHKP